MSSEHLTHWQTEKGALCGAHGAFITSLVRSEVTCPRCLEQVHHPSHYGGDVTYEVIKVIHAWQLGFNLGSVVKYVGRAGKKPGEDKAADLRKAIWYLADEAALPAVKEALKAPQARDEAIKRVERAANEIKLLRSQRDAESERANKAEHERDEALAELDHLHIVIRTKRAERHQAHERAVRLRARERDEAKAEFERELDRLHTVIRTERAARREPSARAQLLKELTPWSYIHRWWVQNSTKTLCGRPIPDVERCTAIGNRVDCKECLELIKEGKTNGNAQESPE